MYRLLLSFRLIPPLQQVEAGEGDAGKGIKRQGGGEGIPEGRRSREAINNLKLFSLGHSG